jgi:hypothetical protein
MFYLARTTATQNSFPAGFLARILPQGPFPSFQTVERLPFGFARNSGHRMHTAARPPRIFTVFPFAYSARSRAKPQSFSQHLKEQ